MFESWLCHSSSVTVVESSVYAVPQLSYQDDHDDDVRSLSLSSYRLWEEARLECIDPITYEIFVSHVRHPFVIPHVDDVQLSLLLLLCGGNVGPF